MRFDRVRKKIAPLLGFVFLLGSMQLPAQSNGRPAIGSLQTQGTVSVEGIPATSGTNLYSGDTVRTGADSAANLNMPDRGSFAISANTEITFLPVRSGAHFASLHQGSIALRLRADAPASTIEVGNVVLTTEPNTETAAEVVMAADGSAHIRCLAGSIGIIAPARAQVVFLQPGDGAETSTDGGVRRIVSAATPQSTAGAPLPGQTTTATGRSHAGLIVLGIGVGVGGAVAALLVSRQEQPVSPMAP
jgi:hypothetical protein